MQRIRIIFMVLSLMAAFSGCAKAAAEQLFVFASIPPQKYFIEQIGGDLVDVQVMVDSGVNPHQYEPKPRQMVALAKARIYFSTGIGFEKVWLPRFTAANPEMIIAGIDQGITKIAMADRYPWQKKKIHSFSRATPQTSLLHFSRHVAEPGLMKGKGQRAAEHHHNAGGLDPHIWTSPPLVRIQAQNILNALVDVDPSHSSLYQSNYRQFIQTVVAIDEEFKAIFADSESKAFMTFHPTWGYFAKTYGIEQIPIEIEGKSPKPAQLQTLISYAKKRGLKVILMQPQFSPKSVTIIASAIGAKVVITDPLAYDWVAGMRRQAREIKAALR